MRRLVSALLPAAIFLAGDAIVTTFQGRVDLLGNTAYHVLLPAAALGRFAGMFVLSSVAWWLLRRLQCGRGWRVLGVLSGPVAYAVSAAVHLHGYFPTRQAAYYALNPLTLAAIGSSVAMAAVAEMICRRRASLGLMLLAAVGWATLFATVLWDGGVHWFYVYQQGYKLLFGQ